MKDDFLNKKLQERKDLQALRQLKLSGNMVDFCSNDYLGIVKNGLLQQPLSIAHYRHGSTGSRLLSGNYTLIEETEAMLAGFHQAEAALIFNSGYDANVGLLSCVPQRGDTILYDQLCHASIRDGIRLSFAQSFSFRHNDVQDLKDKLANTQGQVFIVTESVFSMDGDIAPVKEIISICEQQGCQLILDEAHATGVIGDKGEGVAQHLGLHEQCFARVHTFGKAVGTHGAVIAGSRLLRDYLINFSRPFIYTTALPEVSVAAIKHAYGIFPGMSPQRQHLQELIREFQSFSNHDNRILKSDTPIQGIVIPGNEAVKQTATTLQQKGFDVRPILYPTVPKGGERLRIVLHSFNSRDELRSLVSGLS